MNPNVCLIFKQALCSTSILGRNLRHILGSLNYVNTCDLSRYNPNSICAAIFGDWFCNVTEEDLRVSGQIRELVYMRDSLCCEILNDQQYGDIITYLCTN